ncbi:OmpA family protein [candidate division KSB1 bacterium]|nr:OmpA family protein [candidate division KSB1 bacterium]
MENFRGTLALVCAAVAAVLLLVALWQTASRRKSAGSLNWLYAALFALVSLVLWRRGVEPGSEGTTHQPLTENPAASVPGTSQSQLDSIQRGQAGSALPNPVSGMSPNGQRQIDAPPHERSLTPPDRSRGNVSSAASDDLPPRKLATAESKPSKRPSAGRDVDAPPVEDRIESVIVSAFEFVEGFFDRYGWTASESAPAQAARPVRARKAPGGEEPLVFPAVVFYEGSAELTGDSQSALKLLANELAARPELGILEIQARIDSVGPEAFNYILTQARAAVVRDFLVDEGVPSGRLVARGLGSDAEACDKDSSPIEFVVRR